MSEDKLILAVSDATGETAEQAAQAALAQFGPRPGAELRVVNNLRSQEALREVVLWAKEAGALVVYTLVGAELRAYMVGLVKEHEIPAVDLLGKLVRDLSRHLQAAPLALPGLGHETDESYFERIEAVEFTVAHDDGRLPHHLPQADLVVVGISRTSKTPLASYISNRGYKVANIPIVRDMPLPPELETVDPRRVFALVVDPRLLSDVRQARMVAMGMDPEAEYGDPNNVRQEVAWSRRIYRDHPEWTVVDITRRAIEETAAHILGIWRERFEYEQRSDGEEKKT